MDELIKLYKQKEEELIELYKKIEQSKDGFFYLVVTRVYGSVWKEIHFNEFTVNKQRSKYNGDNGIVDVYTNNDKHTFSDYYDGGSVEVMSEKEIREKYNLK